jgi:hypothetical protein
LERDRDQDTQTEGPPSLRAIPDFLFEDDALDIPSPGRSRPRRPTGAAADYARSTTGAPRRTVRIGGHGAQTALRPTPSELRGPRPDRIAAWAFGFAIFLAILAALVGG